MRHHRHSGGGGSVSSSHGSARRRAGAELSETTSGGGVTKYSEWCDDFDKKMGGVRRKLESIALVKKTTTIDDQDACATAERRRRHRSATPNAAARSRRRRDTDNDEQEQQQEQGKRRKKKQAKKLRKLSKSAQVTQRRKSSHGTWPRKRSSAAMMALARSRALSQSDTCISYEASYEEVEEAAGSAGLVNSDGSLNLSMCLKAAHSVVLKESNSATVCDLSLQILDQLVQIDIIPSELLDSKLRRVQAQQRKQDQQQQQQQQQSGKSNAKTTSGNLYLNELESRLDENFQLACDLCFRLEYSNMYFNFFNLQSSIQSFSRNMKLLGCAYCSNTAKTFLTDQLRGKIKLLLNKLKEKNAKRFAA